MKRKRHTDEKIVQILKEHEAGASATDLSKKVRVKLDFVQPGKPTPNAFVGSFKGKMREYCLDLHWFASIEDARSTIADWAPLPLRQALPFARQQTARSVR
jgi:hypothetical protein